MMHLTTHTVRCLGDLSSAAIRVWLYHGTQGALTLRGWSRESHDKIAFALDLRRETVCRAEARLVAEGLLEVRKVDGCRVGARVVVPDKTSDENVTHME
jgi:hypothetical protein